MKNFLLLSTLVLGGVVPSSATTLEISMSGTFNSQTISTSWAAPGADWTMSFDIDSNPTPTRSYAGVGFDAPISNLVYTLSGSVVSVGPVDVMFVSKAFNGPMAFSLFGCCASADEILPGFQFVAGPQLYSGPESSPTILTGSFVANAYAQITTNPAVGQGAASINSVAVQSAPEPSSRLLLLGITAFGVVLASKRLRVV